MAGVEGALIVGLRIAEDQGVVWPIKMMAVLSAGLLGAGVLRHYWDIYRHRTVRGISFFFVGIDAAGDLFSIVSVRKCHGRFLYSSSCRVGEELTALLVFAPTLDIWAIAIYGVEFVLWMGVFACGSYYNLIPWMVRKLGGGALSPPAEIELRLEHAPIPSADSQLRNRNVPVYLHRLSSSTSVFRTPSGADAVCRASSIVPIHDSSC